MGNLLTVLAELQTLIKDFSAVNATLLEADVQSLGADSAKLAMDAEQTANDLAKLLADLKNSLPEAA